MVTIMQDGPAFALIDRSGDVVALASDEDEAKQLVGEVAPDARVYADFDFWEQEEAVALAANAQVVQLGAAKVRSAPAIAHTAVAKAMGAAGRASGAAGGALIDIRDVLAMDEQTAWEELEPLFATVRPGKGRVKAYETPAKMAESLLGQNYKTSKETPAALRSLVRKASKASVGIACSEADVLGLSLLPHSMSYHDPNVAEIRKEMPTDYRVHEMHDVQLNACTRATRECRASCLVFSGRNLADDYNTVKKYSLLQSLIHHPVAFGRMLVAAIERHRRISLGKNIYPLVRLNVFSDLPWETMFPGLFEHFSGDNFVQFYDYTKVPARKVPENYDLTFSFAGTKQNMDDMDFEVRQNRRRVAVVFARVIERPRGGERVEVPAKTAKGKRGLPKTFMGLPVIDGDVSDMRSFDEAPSVVGLRWKIPANQGVSLVDADIFIVKGSMVGGHFVVSETPRHTPDYSGVISDAAE